MPDPRFAIWRDPGLEPIESLWGCARKSMPWLSDVMEPAAEPEPEPPQSFPSLEACGFIFPADLEQRSGGVILPAARCSCCGRKHAGVAVPGC